MVDNNKKNLTFIQFMSHKHNFNMKKEYLLIPNDFLNPHFIIPIHFDSEKIKIYFTSFR